MKFIRSVGEFIRDLIIDLIDDWIIPFFKFTIFVIVGTPIFLGLCFIILWWITQFVFSLKWWQTTVTLLILVTAVSGWMFFIPLQFTLQVIFGVFIFGLVCFLLVSLPPPSYG
jgi:hypothetical protein